MLKKSVPISYSPTPPARLHTGKIFLGDRSRVGGEDDIDNFLALFTSMKFGSDVQSECAIVQQHRCRLGVLSQHGLRNAFLGCQFANRASLFSGLELTCMLRRTPAFTVLRIVLLERGAAVVAAALMWTDIAPFVLLFCKARDEISSNASKTCMLSDGKIISLHLGLAVRHCL